MRSYWIRVDPKSNMTRTFIRTEDTETYTPRRKGPPMKMKTETGVRQPQTKGC